jgi:hypothetical protein
MKLNQFIIPLTGLALISLASPSHAGDLGPGWDYKGQPGAACQPLLGAQAADFDRYPHYIQNVSNIGRTVICPIVRDSVFPTNLDIGVVVSRTDDKKQGGVKCDFYSMNEYGDTIGSPVQPSEVVPEIPPPAFSDRETQYFSVKAEQTKQDGSYAIECILQSNGRVFSYRSGEYADHTDYGQ